MEENEANVTSNPCHSKKKKKAKVFLMSMEQKLSHSSWSMNVNHAQAVHNARQCSTSNFIGELL